MADAKLRSQADKAHELVKQKLTTEALPLLVDVVRAEVPEPSEETTKIKEKAILAVGSIYQQQGKSAEIAELLKSLRPFFTTISTPKTAKIVRQLIDNLAEVSDADHLVIDLCKEYIEWSNTFKSAYLRQRLEWKLAAAYGKSKEFQSALQILSELLREVKRLDDKPLLVEIHLLESKIQHGLGHLPKARAALTAARTNANSIYCPPPLQAELDVLSGTLHCDEKDYKTAYSYFYESFENYNQLGDPRSVMCLKYMLLCKIMTNIPEDVQSLISGKLALKYAGGELEAMRAVAKAHANSSLKEFKEAIETYKKELQDDPLIHRHLNALYETLLEQNLLRLIEPFSQVQISHVAELINLPTKNVERKLSHMILDKKLNGILDQGNNCLVVFDDPVTDSTYPNSIETINQLGKVVDLLYTKAGKLS